LSSTTTGTLNLQASYAGDANFNFSSSVSVPHTVNPSSGGTAPAAPSDLTAALIYGSSGRKTVLLRIDLKWQDNSNNETNFVIERWKKKGTGTCSFETTFTIGANTSTSNITTFSDTSATTSTCRYRVAAKNASGTSAFASVDVKP
jgi:hypothetical protein